MDALIFLAQVLTRLRDWLTLRRVLHVCALIAIFLLAGQLAAITDVGFLASLDWGLALEVTGAMMILAARTHTTATLRLLRHKLAVARKRLHSLVRRGVSRAARTRPETPQTPPTNSEDGADAPWHWRPLFGAANLDLSLQS
jgi:hypothetical protein